MNILVLFAALAIAHYAKGLHRHRSNEILFRGMRQIKQRWPGVPWLDLLLILVVSIVGGGLLSAVSLALGGGVLWAVVALIVLILAFGPKDLDRDVRDYLELDADNDLGIDPSADAHEAGAMVYWAALSRWFGIVFWFVVLGIPGALLYRLTERAAEGALGAADPDGEDWVFRLRFFLEWPVIALMMVASAMTNDFDRVYQAWHRYRQQVSGQDQGRAWMVHRHLLVELAETVLPDGLDQRGGVQLAHHFVWRMLILWLVVLSLLLLAGWLS